MVTAIHRALLPQRARTPAPLHPHQGTEAGGKPVLKGKEGPSSIALSPLKMFPEPRTCDTRRARMPSGGKKVLGATAD